MSQLHVSKMAGGFELLRMVRPRSSDWDWAGWRAALIAAYLTLRECIRLVAEGVKDDDRFGAALFK